MHEKKTVIKYAGKRKKRTSALQFGGGLVSQQTGTQKGEEKGRGGGHCRVIKPQEAKITTRSV